jgi:hypothetical protein
MKTLPNIAVLLLAVLAFPLAGRGDETVLPGQGFSAAHYESLWIRSPFAVASAETAPESSDYALVGIAQFDGISYASLVDKKSQEHFLLAGNKPANGLTLLSITPGHGGADTVAVVRKNGDSIRLKLQGSGDVLVGSKIETTPAPKVSTPAPTVDLSPSPETEVPRARHHLRVIQIPPPPVNPPASSP